MKRGKIGRCPYCGRFLNYFFLWGCKKSDIGTCNHCGGVFAVKYSFLAYALFVLSIIGFGCTFGYYYLAAGTWPEPLILLAFLGFFFVFYFLLPVLMQPRKCIIHGRLGGFPNPESIPTLKRGLFSRSEEGLEPVEDEPEDEVPNNIFVAIDDTKPEVQTQPDADTEEESDAPIFPVAAKAKPEEEAKPAPAPVPEAKPEPKPAKMAETQPVKHFEDLSSKKKTDLLFEELFGSDEAAKTQKPQSVEEEEFAIYNDLPTPGESEGAQKR